MVQIVMAMIMTIKIQPLRDISSMDVPQSLLRDASMSIGVSVALKAILK